MYVVLECILLDEGNLLVEVVFVVVWIVGLL